MFEPIDLPPDICDIVNDYMINSIDDASEDEIRAALSEFGAKEPQIDKIVGHRADYSCNIIFELYPAGAPAGEAELARRAELTDFARRHAEARKAR